MDIPVMMANISDQHVIKSAASYNLSHISSVRSKILKKMCAGSPMISTVNTSCHLLLIMVYTTPPEITIAVVKSEATAKHLVEEDNLKTYLGVRLPHLYRVLVGHYHSL